jgi:thiopeptide-type bacteriocin biosynthesis protein
MRERHTTPVSWHSYHLFLDATVDRYLVDGLWPMLARELGARRIRRFFFIRYGGGRDAHLRLRFVAAGSCSADQLRERLDESLRTHAAAQPISPGSGRYRLEEHSYSRARDYFGENLVSVHAELLNEATSWLALLLLRSAATPHERFIVLTGLSEIILRQAARERQEYRTLLADSARFPVDAARRLSIALRPEHRGAPSLAETLLSARRRMTGTLERHRLVSRTVRIMRRMRRMPGRGPGAATHGLHLLWNKLGFTLDHEREAFGTLARLDDLDEVFTPMARRIVC